MRRTSDATIAAVRGLAVVHHLAEAANWPRIKAEGLQPAIAASGLPRSERLQLEHSQRRTQTKLPTGVQIRDQRPMPPAALASCLVGMGPADWYALVNARVFLWFDPERLNRQRAACEPRLQVVLTVDSAALIDAHRHRMALTPINTGNARRRPARRGRATFVPYATWVASGWDSEAAAPVVPQNQTEALPGSQLFAPSNVLVIGNTIKTISSGPIPDPTDVPVIRLADGGRTLMPGLIGAQRQRRRCGRRRRATPGCSRCRGSAARIRASWAWRSRARSRT